MAQIRSFRDLVVYQKAGKAAREIFVVTQGFLKEERYSLTDQIRRSSRAVNAMLAEAWGRRRYVAAFVDKVNQAQSEAMETQAWLDHAYTCGYLSDEQY
jgi:four helix bundle protein